MYMRLVTGCRVWGSLAVWCFGVLGTVRGLLDGREAHVKRPMCSADPANG